MTFTLGAAVGLIVGMLGEYWGHRLEHLRYFRPVFHAMHHIANLSRGWVRKFYDDIKYAIWPIAVVSVPFGYYVDANGALGFASGVVGFLVFSAYTHELYHRDPSLIFWTRPLHHFHHEYRQWRHNFGITNSICDRLFGTFLDDPTWTRKPVRIRDLFTARWV